jgi:hypothetical protein
MIWASFLAVAVVALFLPRLFSSFEWNLESLDSGWMCLWTCTVSMRIHLRYADASLLMPP